MFPRVARGRALASDELQGVLVLGMLMIWAHKGSFPFLSQGTIKKAESSPTSSEINPPFFRVCDDDFNQMYKQR